MSEPSEKSGAHSFELVLQEFHACLMAAEHRAEALRKRDQQVLEDRKLWRCRDGLQLELPL